MMQNPFNGIEREYAKARIESATAQNPFNGIESIEWC
jgi:hypothetical protein